jgi:nucleoid DNA-binding protein
MLRIQMASADPGQHGHAGRRSTAEMNKLELITALQKTDGLSKPHAARIVEQFFKAGKDLRERVDGQG